MSPTWVALVLMAAVPAAESELTVAESLVARSGKAVPAGSNSAWPEASAHRAADARWDAPTGTALREAVQDSLRRWSRTSDFQASAAAVELMALLAALQADAQLPPAEREELIARVRGRLTRLADQIARRLTAQQNAAGRPERNASSVRAAQTGAVMAQWGNFAWPGMPGAWGRPAFPPGGPGAMPGPPAGMMPGAAAGGAATVSDDYGWELVELIRRCIAPAHWDVNGGPGSVQYFRPRRALVVTASSEVHEQVHDLVEQLHRAGR